MSVLSPPQIVRVLGVRYRFKLEKPGPLNQNHAGLHRPWQGELLVDADLHHDQQRATALHEAVHAVDFAVHGELAEKQVQALGSGLFALLKDNLEFTAWLIQE